MKKQTLKIIFQLITFLMGLLFLYSCSGKTKKNITSNFYYLNKKIVHFGDTLKLNTESKHKIDSIVFRIGNQKFLNQQEIYLDSSELRYGKNSMSQEIYFTKNNRKRNIVYRGLISIHPSAKEKEMEYELINTYPHQTSDFTQGLIFTKDHFLIESTGEYGSSKLLMYQPGSDSYVKKINLSNQYFGEGVTILNEKIYQLSWQNKKGFVYDLNTFEKTDEFKYPEEIKEGWGLTTNGKELIISDGSNQIYFLEEGDLSKVSKRIEVLGYQNTYSYLNELEYAKHYIYANILGSSYILKINPTNGNVVGRIDLNELAEQNKRYGVLNGIAYDQINDSFFVTGKNWPQLFEIKIKD